MDERYAEAGGGLVNLDFYARAAEAADLIWTLLGEGTFHQVHEIESKHFRDRPRLQQSKFPAHSRQPAGANFAADQQRFRNYPRE